MFDICGRRRLAKLALVTGVSGKLREFLEESKLEKTSNFRLTDPFVFQNAFLEVVAACASSESTDANAAGVKCADPQTKIQTTNLGGVIEIYCVKSIKDLRKQAASKRRLPPKYIEVLKDHVTLEDDDPLEKLGQDSVQIIIRGEPFINNLLAIDGIMKDSEANEKKENGATEQDRDHYWQSMHQQLQLLIEMFDSSDEVHSDQDEKKCPQKSDFDASLPGTKSYITRHATPHCLESRLGIVEAIWNVGRSVFLNTTPGNKIRPTVKADKQIEPDAFENIIDFTHLKQVEILLSLGTNGDFFIYVSGRDKSGKNRSAVIYIEENSWSLVP